MVKGNSALVARQFVIAGQFFQVALVQIPNDPADLAAWIANPQAIKPGDRMPDLGLPSRAVAELVAYLESLR